MATFEKWICWWKTFMVSRTKRVVRKTLGHIQKTNFCKLLIKIILQLFRWKGRRLYLIPGTIPDCYSFEFWQSYSTWRFQYGWVSQIFYYILCPKNSITKKWPKRKPKPIKSPKQTWQPTLVPGITVAPLDFNTFLHQFRHCGHFWFFFFFKIFQKLMFIP